MIKPISSLFILLLGLSCFSFTWAAQDLSQPNKATTKKTVSEQQTNWGKWDKNYTEDANTEEQSSNQDEDFLKELDDNFILDYETHNIEEFLDADEQELDQMEIELLDGL